MPHFVSRRQFGGLAAASAALAAAAPVLAQQSNEIIKWRLTSSFPKSLDTLFGAAATISRIVGEMTDGKFTIQTFAAGEIVPGLQVLDAVSNGTVECGHTYTGYYIGKNPAFIFDGSLPFGLTPRMHNAWMMFGNGRKLMDEVYDSFNIVCTPAGQTGGQMFGWFRKEIKSPKDFEGLKMRTAGFGGKVMAKLGAVPQQIAGGDIYPALE
ncbi:MAG TPA: ABC transporter substrate-binding protein, partial [Hyphomicrobiaceae bacterium]|nr:ABC transporter substrate-binding protein [Hyphomicrobiaceae bacterium]